MSGRNGESYLVKAAPDSLLGAPHGAQKVQTKLNRFVASQYDNPPRPLGASQDYTIEEAQGQQTYESGQH